MSDINQKDYEGDTPLHWAVLLDNGPAVQFLLANGADVSIQNNKRNNVIMIACINQRLEILRQLIEHMINIGKQELANRQMTLVDAQM
mmetsp:Transcript_16457/g.22258  ORF Transcript_16457/g.22258 Transcript_16457/m.22258 type:complete len:88 (+) Transcript_16457:994-1257(+)